MFNGTWDSFEQISPQQQALFALESLSRHDGKRVAQFFLRSIAPPPVPMAVVLASEEIKRAKVFFAAARGTGKQDLWKR